MSDQESEKKVQEEMETKKKQEEAQKRMWIIQLVRDPEVGQTFIVPSQNVQKQWQLDLMLDQASKQQEMTKLSRVVVELLMNVLQGAGIIKEKKKLNLNPFRR